VSLNALTRKSKDPEPLLPSGLTFNISIFISIFAVSPSEILHTRNKRFTIPLSSKSETNHGVTGV